MILCLYILCLWHRLFLFITEFWWTCGWCCPHPAYQLAWSKKKLVNSLVYFRPRAFAISNELAMVGSPNIWAMNSSNGKKSNSYALSHAGMETLHILLQQFLLTLDWSGASSSMNKLTSWMRKFCTFDYLHFFYLKCQSMQESMQEAWCKMPNSLFMAVSVKYCNKNNKKTRRGQIIQRYHLLKIFKLSPSEVSFRGPKQYLH